MKQRTAIIAFENFEISNPTKVVGGSDGPIIDKKKLMEMMKRRRR